MIVKFLNPERMKKMISILIVTFAMLVTFLIPAEADARPFYIKVRIGFLAKWSVVLGECKPGWGICLSLNFDHTTLNQLSYDNETEKLTVMIHVNDPLAKNLQSGYLEIKEDSPVDPQLISQIQNFRQKDKTVVIKAGKYRVLREGDYLTTALEYYVK